MNLADSLRQTMFRSRAWAWLVVTGLGLSMLAGCATNAQPSTTTNVCRIFTERPHWYRATLDAKQRWGAPTHVQMAIIWRESGFRPRVRPPRNYVLGVIPWGRQSSAHGFTQAIDGTWQWYKDSTGNSGASRTDFADSADFVAWYVMKSRRSNSIRVTDTYNQYLAYHEGHGNYRRGSYRQKPAVRKAAREAADMADRYLGQLQQCQSRLRTRRGWFW